MLSTKATKEPDSRTGPVVPFARGGGGRKEGQDPAAAEILLHQQRRAVAEPHDHPHGRIALGASNRPARQNTAARRSSIGSRRGAPCCGTRSGPRTARRECCPADRPPAAPGRPRAGETIPCRCDRDPGSRTRRGSTVRWRRTRRRPPSTYFSRASTPERSILPTVGHADHGEIAERPLRRGQVVGRDDFRLDALAGGQARRRCASSSAAARLAVDQQHGGCDRQVDDGIAMIVGIHRVGIEVGLDQVLAGDGEIDVELLFRRTARRDGVDGRRFRPVCRRPTSRPAPCEPRTGRSSAR